MLKLKSYQLFQPIYEGFKTVIYQAERHSDHTSVIIKTLRSEYPTLEEIARIRHEYNILKTLKKIEGIIKPIELTTEENSLVLVLEYFESQSLKKFINTENLDLKQFLNIAIQIADILDKLHQNQVIHKDIKPSNIIINPQTRQVKIIDFSIATRLERETQSPINPNCIEGTLAYMSPEQTGRMNRTIDYRTDFYSLGVTFYEMLTDQLPFDAVDPMELIHCHIAKKPIPLHQRNSELPITIANIVTKLLAKNAEDRYQSALGLKSDLEDCLTQLQTTGTIKDFIPGRVDKTGQFLIPQKLYGREVEVKTLLQAFERVSLGKSEMMLVSGYSGIGKTCVIQEIHKPIVRQRGYFIRGKFDQFKRDIPYAAITQAFQELIRQLLTQNYDEIAVWKEKLLVALGENGQIIIDVIPEVELIIGKQPEVSQLGLPESQNLFNRIFQQFIYVFARPSHPLVLFLDDLQWSDLASLNLIKQLMTDSDSHYLLMIGAYRDNEVSPVHPTIQTLEKIEKAGCTINNIVLQHLNISHVSELVGDTLSEVAISDNRISKLAELLYNKTQGNPFFLTQLFKTLASEKVLSFNFELNQWQWSIEKIQSLGITDLKVVELVAMNIRKLPEDTQQILKLAACIGNQFNLDALAIVNEKSSTDTTEYLWSALQAGLVLPLSNDYKIALLFQSEDKSELLFNKSRVAYKFLHDRVQQAAYSLIPESDKKATHLKIGQLLWKNTPRENLEDNIFDIVNQVNIGREFIISPHEKEELAALNLIAGRKAKAATAYEIASKCLNVALDLLPESCWQNHYELTRDIYREALEAEYLNVNFEEAQNLSKIILYQSKNLLEKVQVNELKIPFYLQQNQPHLSLELSLQTLQVLGVFLPSKPKKINILLEFIYTKSIIAKQPISSLATLFLMRDSYKLAAMRILMNAVPAAFMENPGLFPLIVFKMVSLSIKYGNSPLSGYGYACYALLMCGPLGDINTGYMFGQLALSLLELKQVKIRAKILFFINIFVRHWKEPIKDTLPGLIEGFQSGISTGDIEYACYIAAGYCQYLLWSGEHLQSVYTTQYKYICYLEKNKQAVNLEVSQIWNQFACNLMGGNEIPYSLKGGSFDETARLSILKSTNNKTLIANVYLSKLLLLYLFKDYWGSVKVAKLAEECQESISGQVNIAQYNFYYSLALLAHYPATIKSEQKQYLKKVASHQKQMKTWAHHAPMNFQHKYDLVEAEKALVLGQNEIAITYYERAIKGAKEQGFIQEEALANERAAEFYLALGREKVAKTYMTEAYYCYIRWGAVAKVRDLEETYFHLSSRTQQPEPMNLDPTSTTTSNRTTTSTSDHSTSLDLGTIMKAAQALSGEIILSELLGKLMTILIENAGATRGVLLTKPTFSSNQSEEQWVISATGIVESNDLTVLTNSQQSEEKIIVFPLENAVPTSILNYVTRTKQTVVLNDARHEGIFKEDPYIQRNQPKSVLCTPLLNQGQITGIIYLENNLTTVAFTTDRLTVLQMLSGQAAIAITNAKLYEEVNQLNQNLEQANQQLAAYSETLEQKVEERTTELKTAQKQIVASEKLASLGALTAGIAHEIRNPLNFVTSLATLSEDLTSEIAEQVDRHSQNLDSQFLELINENLTYLKRNVSEINEQGQRANSIIQNMLLHARSEGSSRQKTDINALVAQSLKLAYHSIRAKDKTFNLTIKTDYDQSIEELDVIFSDLSRAFINIIDNACYASYIKQFKMTADFNPTVSLTTKNLGTAIEIRIRDNGIGIPQENQPKIFLPFFTTKPPGQGTGLGLSITHDIIVGQHRGNLEVQTSPGDYTEFIITLPKI